MIHVLACETCGIVFSKKGAIPKRSFCSRECDTRKHGNNSHGHIEKRICVQCGKEFNAYITSEAIDICSRECEVAKMTAQQQSILRAREIRDLRAESERNGIWVDAEGNAIPVVDISDSHLFFIAKFLYRRAIGNVQTYVEFLERDVYQLEAEHDDEIKELIDRYLANSMLHQEPFFAHLREELVRRNLAGDLGYVHKIAVDAVFHYYKAWLLEYEISWKIDDKRQHERELDKSIRLLDRAVPPKPLERAMVADTPAPGAN